MENGRRDAFEVAREALLKRYATLDPARLRQLGADEVVVGAARNIVARDSKGLTREQRLILACPPTNINTLLAGSGLPAYVPTVEHSLDQCQDCSTSMWVGPKQREVAKRRSASTLLLLCMGCAAQEVDRREQPTAVGHLDGGQARPRLAG